MGMQITDVRVRRIEKEGKMKAIVSITLDNEFVVHDIKVIEGEKGLFIAMPSRKAADGEYRDIAHPINSETRDISASHASISTISPGPLTPSIISDKSRRLSFLTSALEVFITAFSSSLKCFCT